MYILDSLAPSCFAFLVWGLNQNIWLWAFIICATEKEAGCSFCIHIREAKNWIETHTSSDPHPPMKFHLLKVLQPSDTVPLGEVQMCKYGIYWEYFLSTPVSHGAYDFLGKKCIQSLTLKVPIVLKSLNLVQTPKYLLRPKIISLLSTLIKVYKITLVLTFNITECALSLKRKEGHS